jgi:hypothetical protein
MVLTTGQADRLKGANAYEIMAIWRREGRRQGISLVEINHTLKNARRGTYKQLCNILGIPI